MKIAIGADHGGFSHKEEIIKFLKGLNHDVVDVGTYNEDSVDYNDFAVKVANKVVSKEVDKGILICGTGIGMSIMANKVKGIRAALVHDLFTAEATRLHNNTNVLAMGGRVIPLKSALDIVNVWINTEFSNEDRHIRRISKIDEYKGE